MARAERMMREASIRKTQHAEEIAELRAKGKENRNITTKPTAPDLSSSMDSGIEMSSNEKLKLDICVKGEIPSPIISSRLPQLSPLVGKPTCKSRIPVSGPILKALDLNKASPKQGSYKKQKFGETYTMVDNKMPKT